MNNGVYFSQFERGRRDWFFRVGSYKFFGQFNQGFVLTGLTTRFRKEIEFLQPFKVITKLLYYDDYHIYLEQRIISQGFVHCIAYADCSIVNTKTKRRAKTDTWIKFLGLADDNNDNNDNDENSDAKKDCQPVLTPPPSLLEWIKYLKASSNEIRAEAGLPPKK